MFVEVPTQQEEEEEEEEEKEEEKSVSPVQRGDDEYDVSTDSDDEFYVRQNPREIAARLLEEEDTHLSQVLGFPLCPRPLCPAAH